MALLTREGICAVTQIPEQANVSSSSSPVAAQSDDDDDFVPYQGERFTVFDWMLFRVFTLVVSVANLLMTETRISQHINNDRKYVDGSLI